MQNCCIELNMLINTGPRSYLLDVIVWAYCEMYFLQQTNGKLEEYAALAGDLTVHIVIFTKINLNNI